MSNIRTETEKLALAADICRLCESCFRQGIEPKPAFEICWHFFKNRQPCKAAFIEACREAQTMMEINTGWGIE